MPSVAAQSIAPLSVAAVPIATPFGVGSYAEPSQYPPGSYTFAPSRAGRWKFVLWGAGSGANAAPASSGAYCEVTRRLSLSDRVAIVSGVAVGGVGAASAVTFPDGTVVTAGGGNGATPGVASGGDVNLDGSAPGVAGLGTGGGAAGGGGGAPANLPYRGGNGGSGTSVGSPGGGMAIGGGVSYPGGSGLVLAVFVGD